MKSKTRQECEDSVRKFSEYISNNISGGNLLYCGLAGDPPGGEYAPMFPNFNIKTFDIDACWRPDIVGDITKTTFEDESWDVIVCVQTLEHIPNLFDVSPETSRILKKGGFLIIDSPWMYPYHGEPQFGDYWRLTKDAFKVLFEKEYELVMFDDGENNKSALLRKK